MIWRSHFVHCILARTSPVAVRVAVHAWSSIGARDEVCGVGKGMSEVSVVGRVCLLGSAKPRKIDACPDPSLYRGRGAHLRSRISIQHHKV